MSFITQKDSTGRTWTLHGNDLAFGDDSTPDVAPLTVPEWFRQLSDGAGHRFFPQMTASQVKNRAPEGGWFVGPPGRTRQRMRKVAAALEGDGWDATVSASDDGTSLLSVMPPRRS